MSTPLVKADPKAAGRRSGVARSLRGVRDRLRRIHLTEPVRPQWLGEVKAEIERLEAEAGAI